MEMSSFKAILLIQMVLILFVSCKGDNKENTAIIINESAAKIDTTDALISIYKKEGDALIVPWDYLMNVKFEEKYDEKMGMEVSLPIFNDTLQILNGREVIVEGFYIPVDETGDEKIVILSAYPFAQCFFCGEAGVESIVDILSPSKLPKLKIDTKIKFKGKFKLNRDNFDYLIYMLENAELID
jgi:hypothetical protein